MGVMGLSVNNFLVDSINSLVFYFSLFFTQEMTSYFNLLSLVDIIFILCKDGFNTILDHEACTNSLKFFSFNHMWLNLKGKALYLDSLVNSKKLLCDSKFL